LHDAAKRVWVAEDDGRVVGFVAAGVVDEARLIGEIAIVAVDPAAQGQGIGSSLTEHATGWLREQGLRVAVLGTGGDASHAPARRVYERLGFRLFPARSTSARCIPPEQRPRLADESQAITPDCRYRLHAEPVRPGLSRLVVAVA
jgi:N-acetylglutamate synthase-like GNAT family acetyltransferase